MRFFHMSGRFHILGRITVAFVTIAVLAGSLSVSASATTAAPAATAAPAGRATVVTPGLKGYDNLAAENQSQINCLSAAGYSFDVIDVIGDAWQGEYNAAAAAGMTIVMFQGFDATTWATPAQGTTRGGIIAAKATLARYPKGAQIFLNLEQNTPQAAPGVTVAKMLAWINNWTRAVRSAGYVPGIYVGVPQLLTAGQINTIAGAVFWRSASSSAPQAGRGFVVRQPSVSRPACGIVNGIDTDVAGIDTRGARLIGAAFPKTAIRPTAAGAFVPLTPTRLLDTRSSLGGSGPVAANKAVNLQVTGRGGVPATGVAAVVMNVTVTAPTSLGFVTAYPTGSSVPAASSLNYVARQTVANLVTVRVGSGGRVTLFNGAAATRGNPASIQLVADVAGYYLSGTATRPGTFVAVTPARLLDTRPRAISAGPPGITVALAGRAGVPSTGFDSAVLNLTVVGPTAPGNLTAYPAGTGVPPTSNLNFGVGQTVPNMATVKIPNGGAASGRVALMLNGFKGRANLLADISGYYNAGARIDSGAFVPLTPARLLDTRSNVGAIGKVPAASAISLLVRGRGGVPAGASAVALNVTVVNQAALGYVSVFPSDRSTPVASNINFVANRTVANQVILPIGADGRVILLNQSAGTTDLLADVAGYFRP